MKTSAKALRSVFFALQVMTWLLIAISMVITVSSTLLFPACSGSSAVLATLTLVAGELLLLLACWMFLCLCGRLRRGFSAFTAQNAKGLGAIGRCLLGLSALSVMLLVPYLPDLFGAAADSGAVINVVCLYLFIPLLLLCAGLCALVLRSLLLRAMALEEEQALTI